MSLHRYVWVSMGVYECIWVFGSLVGVYGYLWAFMSVMDVYGYL